MEVEDLTEKTILGRWCGSQLVPTSHTSKGSQIRIRFVSDEYFPSEPGFCIHYSLLPEVSTASALAKLTNVHREKLGHRAVAAFFCFRLQPQWGHMGVINASPCKHN